jgi:hypothetical protein
MAKVTGENRGGEPLSVLKQVSRLVGKGIEQVEAADESNGSIGEGQINSPSINKPAECMGDST